MDQLHRRKAADYAAPENPYSNFEFAARLAEGFPDPVDRVFATLLGVKLARIQQLSGGRSPENEPLGDSFLDLAMYAALWAAYRRRSM